MKLIRNALKNSTPLSLWLLETFSSQELLIEFLIDCPIPDMKRFVGGLLRTAMRKVYEYENQQIKAYCSQIELNSFIDHVKQTHQELIKNQRTIDMGSNTKGETFNSSP